MSTLELGNITKIGNKIFVNITGILIHSKKIQACHNDMQMRNPGGASTS